eukprot:GHVN01050821.1.p1 GENE.GHVN01050821.1~~GHVN01050821.1.p1  ORF type:complete len:179 (-),score=18.94 GHVN01050821.1:271-807(-)
MRMRQQSEGKTANHVALEFIRDKDVEVILKGCAYMVVSKPSAAGLARVLFQELLGFQRELDTMGIAFNVPLSTAHRSTSLHVPQTQAPITKMRTMLLHQTVHGGERKNPSKGIKTSHKKCVSDSRPVTVMVIPFSAFPLASFVILKSLTSFSLSSPRFSSSWSPPRRFHIADRASSSG